MLTNCIWTPMLLLLRLVKGRALISPSCRDLVSTQHRCFYQTRPKASPRNDAESLISFAHPSPLVEP